MKRNLFIEEYIEEIEEDLSVDYEHLGWYLDDKTNIKVYHKYVAKDLEVGKIYEFTFEDDQDSDTYDYVVVKKNDDGTYLLCEKYGGYSGKLYAVRNRNLLCECWKICNVKDELGFDLSEWM